MAGFPLKTVALRFGLRPHEKKLFGSMYRRMGRHQQKLMRRWREDMLARVDTSHDKLRRIFAPRPGEVAPTGLGFGEVATLDLGAVPGVVVFSDHHLTHVGHRQGFFRDVGNLDLYVEALGEYQAQGWTLVENGDVEELLVLEPDAENLPGSGGLMEWRRARQPRRLGILGRILAANAHQAYYAKLRELQEDGRFVRVVGNHDYDIQRAPFLDLWQQRLGWSLDKPADVLVMRGPARSYLVCHGHQLDPVCHPEIAGDFGEVFSETLAWAFQGADRTWRWQDHVDRWADGREAVPNYLSVDEAFEHKLLSIHELADPGSRERVWERLFGHEVAWEYFEGLMPTQAVTQLVLQGREFFKYRHIDERRVDARQREVFAGQERPTLVLGHSHEPRLDAAIDLDGDMGAAANIASHYLNSGSAGRFENLLWALEITATGHRVVSWSRPRPGMGGAQRREWVSLAGSFSRAPYTGRPVRWLRAGPVSSL